MDVNQKYTNLLKEQIDKIGKECRYLEFKSNYQEVDKLGRYISALSNGACLDHQDFAYLYFGVDDDTLAIKGTTFDCAKVKAVGNEALELYLRRMVVPKVNFSIIEFMYEEKERVVLFKIPAAVNEPTTYKQKPYIRVDSHVTDLTPYVDWMRQIYTSQIDWSAQIVEDATIEDLDPEAIRLARAGYKLRYPDFAEAMESWDDTTFLDKAHVTQDGQITRTALLLVGKQEKVYKLHHIAQMVWKCFQDGDVFGDIYTIPYIKATTALMGRIRNYRFKIYPQDSLIPAEVWKYDTRSILEGLHNCIAHQNYLQNSLKENGNTFTSKVRPVKSVARSELRRKAFEPVIDDTIEHITLDVDEMNAKAKEMAQQGLNPTTEELQKKRKYMEAVKKLSSLKRDMETAHEQLASLMGLHPATQFMLVGKEYGNFALPEIKSNLSRLEWLALTNRPELKVHEC